MSSNKIVVEKEVLEFLEEQAQSIFLHTFPNLKDFTAQMKVLIRKTINLPSNEIQKNVAVLQVAKEILTLMKERNKI